MTRDEVLDVFRQAGGLLEGHFILSSGRRSGFFIQKMRVFESPVLTEKLCRALGEKFAIRSGERGVVIEDIVTTGLFARECINSLADQPGEIVGAACLIDRSGGRVKVGIPLLALCEFAVPDYDPGELPPELARIPPAKPGSRGLQGA